MKPLLVLARIVIMGCLWSIIFTESVRVLMLQNWHFDIFWPPHWTAAWNLWSSGWVIDTPKEWAFILIIVGFVPLWLGGWVALALVPWEQWLEKALKYPFKLYHSIVNPIKVATKTPVVVKKKSYKEIRPKGTRAPIYSYNDASNQAQKPDSPNIAAPQTSAPAPTPAFSLSPATPTIKEKAATARETFSHSLFNLTDDDDDDFDLDFESLVSADKKKPAQQSTTAPKKPFEADDDDDFDLDKNFDEDDDFEPQPRRRKQEKPSFEPENRRNNKNNRRENANERNKNTESRNNRPESNAPRHQVNPVADVLSQKGYHILTAQTIRNTIIDFIGIAENKILLCLLDKEPGDWLADEERFNNEEPLWFSESSHRISPVRKVDLCRQALKEKLNENNLNLDIEAYVVIQMGNIINAEDMFDAWDELDVKVTRINRGAPREIKLFSKTVEESDGRLERAEFDVVRKIIRNLA